MHLSHAWLMSHDVLDHSRFITFANRLIEWRGSSMGWIWRHQKLMFFLNVFNDRWIRHFLIELNWLIYVQFFFPWLALIQSASFIFRMSLLHLSKGHQLSHLWSRWFQFSHFFVHLQTFIRFWTVNSCLVK